MSISLQILQIPFVVPKPPLNLQNSQYWNVFGTSFEIKGNRFIVSFQMILRPDFDEQIPTL